MNLIIFIEAFSIERLLPFLASLSKDLFPEYTRYTATELMQRHLCRFFLNDLDISQKVQQFERRLHERLLTEERVFSTRRGIPLD
jgi:hypothetical protein